MDKVQALMQRMSGIQYRITNNDRAARRFGTPYRLYQSEIHMIEAIGPGEGLAAPELAKKLSITRGGVTQTAAKLIAKALIERYHREGNRKEVFYRLTEMGERAYHRHEAIHAAFRAALTSYLSELDAHDFEVVAELAALVDGFVPDFSKEKEEE